MEFNRSEIIAELQRYFDIREIACPHTYNTWGDKSWRFFTTPLLATLLTIRRDLLKVPMYINDYKNGGKNTQRGNRCNLCNLVSSKTNAGKVYLSQHMFGNAFDCVFDSKSGMTAQKARDIIRAGEDILPYVIRLEEDVTWLHVDCMDLANGHKVTGFKS